MSSNKSKRKQQSTNPNEEEIVDPFTELVEQFSTVVEEAESNSEIPGDLAQFRSKFERHEPVWADFLKYVRENEYPILTEAGDSVLSGIQAVIEALVPKSLSGDAARLATRVRGLVMAELLDEDLSETAQKLLERWEELQPKKKSPSEKGKTSAPDLGFTVVVECNDHEWSTSTKKHNVANIRETIRKHHKEDHGEEFGRGDKLHKRLTTGLKAIMEGEEEERSASPYKMKKS